MIWTILSAILILLGIVGTLAPLLPGAPLALGGLLLYGYVTDFEGFSGWAVAIFIVLTLFTFFIDFFGPAFGTAGKRASRSATIGATLGAVLGIFVFGPVGIIVGPLLGAFVAEYLATRNLQTAMQVTRGVFVAFIVGTAVKLGIVFAMAGYFIYLLFQ